MLKSAKIIGFALIVLLPRLSSRAQLTTVTLSYYQNNVGVLNKSGDTLLPVKYKTIRIISDSFFLVHKHSGDFSFIQLPNDSLNITQSELLPTGNSWKKIQKRYDQNCKCYQEKLITKEQAIEIAKKNNYYASDGMEYNSIIHVTRIKNKCAWYINTFFTHGDKHFVWSSEKEIWINMKTGQVLKKKKSRDKDSEKQRKYEKI